MAGIICISTMLNDVKISAKNFTFYFSEVPVLREAYEDCNKELGYVRSYTIYFYRDPFAR